MRTDAAILKELERRIGWPIAFEMEEDRCVTLDLTSRDYLYHGLIRHHSFGEKQDILHLVCRLTSLRRLDLQRNKLAKLPDAFWELQQLEWLNLGSNYLGAVPPSLRFLRRLKFLHLANNQLTGLPGFMSNFESLEYLALHKNIKLKSIDNLSALREIRHLNLHYLNIIRVPDFIYRWKQLVTLTVWNVSDFSDELANLQSLEFFSACGCRRLRRLPEALCALKKLRMMRLFKNNLEVLPGDFGNLKKLEQISLYQNALHRLPESCSELKNLQKLNLACNRFKFVPKSLARCESLRWLAIFDNPLKHGDQPSFSNDVKIVRTRPFTTPAKGGVA